MSTLSLEKYEALGNDFLVVVDPDRRLELDAELAAALCDRHRGAGADGLIRLASSTLGAAMELRNADGGIAETSGNGLRCAALAARRSGLVASDEFAIETLAGIAGVAIRSRAGAGAVVAVEMGTLTVVAADSPLVDHVAFAVDVGNPHLVLLGQLLDDAALAELGARLDAETPGGVNVEVVEVRSPSELALTVFERGAGLTRACGSGSAAAAAAARFAGLGEVRVVVRNPGGDLEVELAGTDPARPAARLIGPARHVAEVRVELDELPAREAATR